LPAGTITIDLWGDPADYHGDTRYRDQLATWLDRPGVRAHGRISHDHVAAALAEIDVLVLPSIWPENSPLVIREAFLAGVPAVAARIGGIPEAVTDGVNGLLFDPGSAADLGRALSRLLNEPDLLPRLQRGIPVVRTLADDVATVRERYVQALGGPSRRLRLAAVVLNYRAPNDTFLAARSLLHSDRPPDDLIVVDNDSSADAEAALQSIRGRVTYIRTGANLGFSGGMNAGITAALARGAARVLLVNSDVVVPPDCVARLERAMDATPQAGVAGPILLARHAPDRVASAGMSYDARTGRMRHIGVGAPPSDGVSATVVEVAGVSGSVMLITREAFEKVGLLDPDYFFSFEDLDFCLRARAAGLTSIVVGGAAAFHEGGQSMGARSPRRLYFGARNHLLVARRASVGQSAAGRLGRAGIIVGLNLAHAMRAPGGTLVSRVGAVVRGTRDYVAGRFGEDAGR
jgi:GT2 family glycosyltransferase